jgi:hypothetical protein
MQKGKKPAVGGLFSCQPDSRKINQRKLSWEEGWAKYRIRLEDYYSLAQIRTTKRPARFGGPSVFWAVSNAFYGIVTVYTFDGLLSFPEESTLVTS